MTFTIFAVVYSVIDIVDNIENENEIDKVMIRDILLKSYYIETGEILCDNDKIYAKIENVISKNGIVLKDNILKKISEKIVSKYQTSCILDKIILTKILIQIS